MSELLSSVVGGGGLPKLAPDLTFPSTLTGTSGFVSITGINAVGSLTTALSLTGKFAIYLLTFKDMTAESHTFKLTIDGVVIWDDTFVSGATLRLFGSSNAGNADVPSMITCDTSLLLEVQSTTDPTTSLDYLVRAIL